MDAQIFYVAAERRSAGSDCIERLAINFWYDRTVIIFNLYNFTMNGQHKMYQTKVTKHVAGISLCGPRIAG